jgi:hypothetical protein
MLVASMPAAMAWLVVAWMGAGGCDLLLACLARPPPGWLLFLRCL